MSGESSLYKRFFSGGKRNGERKSVGGSRNMNMNTNTNFLQLLNDKKGFLGLVFGNLILQLGITYYVMTHYNTDTGTNKSDKNNNKSNNSTAYWLSIIGSFVCILILAFVPMSPLLKFCLFSLFSGLLGITLSFLQNVTDPALIHMAIFGTMTIFGAMLVLGALLVMVGFNLGIKFATFLFFSLLFLIITQVVLLFTGAFPIHVKLISIAGLFLFSLYIVYDTNHILQENYAGDFITASLDYYLDIVNIFVDLIGFYRN